MSRHRTQSHTRLRSLNDRYGLILRSVPKGRKSLMVERKDGQICFQKKSRVTYRMFCILGCGVVVFEQINEYET